jgi:hypothetical protein
MRLSLSQEERLVVISNTCEQTGLFPQAVEKDWWVQWRYEHYSRVNAKTISFSKAVHP